MAFMIYDKSDYDNKRGKLIHVYDRVALPIDKGGISLRNVENVIFIAFSWSLAALLKETSSFFLNGLPLMLIVGLLLSSLHTLRGRLIG